MIYDIELTNDDQNYRDVQLDTALDDYAGPTWKRVVTLEKESEEVLVADWEFSAEGCISFEAVPPNDVPLWCKRLYAHLEPRIMEMLKAPNPKPYRSFVESLQNEECVGA